MKDDLIRTVDAESDDIAIAQRPLLHLLTVHKQAIAIAAILQAVACAFGDNRRALPRDASIGQLQMIVALSSAAEVKRCESIQGNRFPRAVGSDHFQQWRQCPGKGRSWGSVWANCNMQD